MHFCMCLQKICPNEKSVMQKLNNSKLPSTFVSGNVKDHC